MSNTSEITMTIDGEPVDFVRKDSVSKPADLDGMPYVIARCTKAGVHAGYLVSRDENGYVILSRARRIWHWKGAATLSELAVYGSSSIETCKFASEIATQEIAREDVCELIHCQRDGAASIQSAKEWRA